MTKILVGAAIAACFLAASPANACRRAVLDATPEVAAGFSEILAVEATGVHLIAYEHHQLIKRGLVAVPERADGIEYMYPTSATPSYEAYVLVDKAARGTSEPTRRFTLSGCSVAVPALREKGIVFVGAQGEVFALWASQSSEYLPWARYLGLPSADEP